MRQKLPWFQFSLRQLLILLTASAVLLGYLGYKLKQAKQQKDYLAEPQNQVCYFEYAYYFDGDGILDHRREPKIPQWLIDLFGLDVFYGVGSVDIHDSAFTDQDLLELTSIPGMESIEKLSLPSGKITESGLSSLDKLPRLCVLDLFGIEGSGMESVSEMKGLRVLTPGEDTRDKDLRHVQKLVQLQALYLATMMEISDEGVSHLAGLTKLEFLSLNQTKVTDDGLKYLAELVELRSLDLGGTEVRGPGLVHLKNLRRLERLSLSNLDVSDEDLIALESMKRLISLSLGNTKITDRCLAGLSELTNLYELNLWNTQITDRGILEISKFPALKKLNLSETEITDASVEPLSELRGLFYLDIRSTQLTPEGIQRLKKNLPGCSISSD